NLSRQLTRLDSIFNLLDMNYEVLDRTILAIDSSFIHVDSRTFDDPLWKSFITYKWSVDSSVIMIRSKKNYDVGFKREVALHINDSMLFLHRFEVGPALDTPGYNFLETYD